MTNEVPSEGLQLRSLVTEGGTLELSLASVPVPEPGPNEVLIRVEAAPINPSDLGLLLAGADVTAATASGSAERPVVTMPIPAGAMAGLGARVGESMAVGNEGAGTVVAAGANEAAQALVGRVVAAAGGAMYGQYRAVDVGFCLPLPEGTVAADGASSFVNPLTALGMVETMRREGHTGLVHTAAASNLGQMLDRLCREDGIPLVCIVRRPEQAELLRGQGAEHVVDSSAPTFADDLDAALRATGATLAFDATGGGELVDAILSAMERVASADAQFSRYGSTTHKQAYIYGGLDRSPTILRRTYGMAWGIGGWLLTPFLGTLGPEDFARLRQRVADGLATTFHSTYAEHITLAQALDPAVIRAYARQATGAKYLLTL